MSWAAPKYATYHATYYLHIAACREADELQHGRQVRSALAHMTPPSKRSHVRPCPRSCPVQPHHTLYTPLLTQPRHTTPPYHTTPHHFASLATPSHAPPSHASQSHAIPSHAPPSHASQSHTTAVHRASQPDCGVQEAPRERSHTPPRGSMPLAQVGAR